MGAAQPCCLSRSADTPRAPRFYSSAVVTFDPASPDFDRLHTGFATLLAASDEPLFHEAGVWMPQTNEWLFVSDRLLPGTPETFVKILAVSPSGALRRLKHLDAKIIMGNGGTTDFAGGAYLCSQGLGDISGTLWHIDPTLSDATLVGPPEGLTLNSLNDVVVHRGSGELIFTDPAYGIEAQGFRTSFNAAKAVWSVHPSKSNEIGCWRKLSERFDQPNGIAFSPDEQTAYVTDVWSGKWQNNPHVKLKNTAGAGGEKSSVTAFDVATSGDGVSLVNPRLFVDLRQEAGASGYPDGIKCDELGNVYTGCGGGVRVYSPEGMFLGRITVEGGVANLCFGGADGKTLLMLNATKAYTARMKVKGAI